MKIEIDLEKVRADVLFRKEQQVASGDLVVQVRQWGEMNTTTSDIDDDILIDIMKKHIEMKIAEFMIYAPDVTEIKPGEIYVGTAWPGIKTVTGTFYYASQIVDHWEKKKDMAVEAAQRELRERIAWEIEAQYCVEDEPDKCIGVNREHCEVLTQAAKIVRGERYE